MLNSIPCTSHTQQRFVSYKNQASMPPNSSFLSKELALQLKCFWKKICPRIIGQVRLRSQVGLRIIQMSMSGVSSLLLFLTSDMVEKKDPALRDLLLIPLNPLFLLNPLEVPPHPRHPAASRHFRLLFLRDVHDGDFQGQEHGGDRGGVL